MSISPRIAIVGAGAAGYFAAARLKEMLPQGEIHLFESTAQVLRKVAISGGGRCNVTNARSEPRELIEHYPRGSKELRGAFSKFNSTHMRAWLDQRSVELKEEDNGRMFPISDDSQTIIDVLRKSAEGAGVHLHLQHSLQSLHTLEEKSLVYLSFSNGIQENFNAAILACGSAPRVWNILESLGVSLINRVPSLFSFNVPEKPLHQLSGMSCENARVFLCVNGRRFEKNGPLLITHWGFSGPAILWCSAWAARDFFTVEYQAELKVSWDVNLSEDILRTWIEDQRIRHPKKKIIGLAYPGFQKRLWQFICQRAGIDDALNFAELSKKIRSALLQEVCNATFQIKGKTTYKDEFVTAGGIDLKQVDMQRMELKELPRVFAAGELLNIDGVTGGFNFQAAWTTAHLAARAIADDFT